MKVADDAASGCANTSLNAEPAVLVPPRADATRLPAAAIPEPVLGSSTASMPGTPAVTRPSNVGTS